MISPKTPPEVIAFFKRIEDVIALAHNYQSTGKAQKYGGGGKLLIYPATSKKAPVLEKQCLRIDWVTFWVQIPNPHLTPSSGDWVLREARGNKKVQVLTLIPDRGAPHRDEEAIRTVREFLTGHRH